MTQDQAKTLTRLRAEGFIVVTPQPPTNIVGGSILVVKDGQYKTVLPNGDVA